MTSRVLTSSQQLVALRFSHVPLPDCAIDCEPWKYNDGVWTRLLTVREWLIGAMLIAVAGEQTHTGAVVYWLYVGGENQFGGSDRRSLLDALAEADHVLHLLG